MATLKPKPKSALKTRSSAKPKLASKPKSASKPKPKPKPKPKKTEQTLTVYGNGNLGENARWEGNTWIMLSAKRFPMGDRKEQCGGYDHEYRIAKSKILDGPTPDGICTTGFGKAWKVTAKFDSTSK